MENNTLNFVNYLAGAKTAVNAFHWESKNMDLHHICQDLSYTISDAQDTIAEIEQSIKGKKFSFNDIKAKPIKSTAFKTFLKNLLTETKKFYEQIDKLGIDYVGMKAKVAEFIGRIQTYYYQTLIALQENKRMGGMLSKIITEELNLLK